MKSNKIMPSVRKWSRGIHRDLSFLFSGVIIIYAISGICLNHKADFNSDYSVTNSIIQLDGTFPMEEKASKEQAVDF